MKKKETAEDWWARMKDVPYHPDDHLMSFIEWSCGLEFQIHLTGTAKKEE